MSLRRKIKVVIRHVVVPGITDTVEECEKLGRLIAPWHNVVGLEMLPYHTMGVVKYEQLGIPYKLEGAPDGYHAYARAAQCRYGRHEERRAELKKRHRLACHFRAPKALIGDRLK